MRVVERDRGCKKKLREENGDCRERGIKNRERMREKEAQTDRQTDKQTERQTASPMS